MARNKGLASFSANFESQMAAPIDARMVVATVSDLILAATWVANDGSSYVYPGMIVSVAADSAENNGLYFLKALPTTTSSNWERVGDTADVESEIDHLNELKRSYQGFYNRTDSTITVESGTFYIRPTVLGGSYRVYLQDSFEDITVDYSAELVADKALHYIYFDMVDGTLTLISSTDVWDLKGLAVPVAIVFHQDTVYALQDERHGYARNREWHSWAHNNIGTMYNSGLQGTFTASSLSITQGVIYDEDLRFDTEETKTTTTLWFRDTDSAKMQIIRGATAACATIEASPGVFELAYDLNGVLTAISGNAYVVNWVYCSPDVDEPIYTVVSQASYANITAARNATLPVIRLSTAEWKLLYRVIYRRTGTGTMSYIEASDYRSVPTGVPTSPMPPSSHSSLTDREAANSHPASAISIELLNYPLITTVQAAIETLQTVATGDITVAVSSTGSDSDTNRPSMITTGDWSAYPFLTIQAAIDALPSFVRPYTATINVGAGNFTGAKIFQRAGNYKIVGTLDLSTLASGSNAGTFSSGAARAATKTGESWTVDNLKGHFVKITAGRGAGQERVIVSNTADTITVAKKWVTSIDSTSVFQILEPKSIITTAVLDPYGSLTIGLGGFEYNGRLTIENFAFALGTAIASIALVRGDFSSIKTVRTSQSYYPIVAQDMDEISITRMAALNVIYYGSYFLRIAKSVGFGGEMFIDGSVDRTYFYSCRGIEFNGLYFNNIAGAHGINFWDSTAVITDMVITNSARGLLLARSALVIHGLEIRDIANNAIELQDLSSLKIKTSLTSSNLNYGIVLSNSSLTSIYVKGMDATHILHLDALTVDNVEYEEMITTSGDTIYGTAGSQLMYSNT